jgi:hypothetical protein
MLRQITIFILASTGITQANAIGFNTHIRPLLSDHCFACHGFDANSREADLRLDTPEGAFAKRKNGAGIIPGNPEESLIWQRIISDDPDEVMPPPEHLVKLDAKEKKLIYRWIKEGAKYEKHWTFIPVQKPVLPTNGIHPVDDLVTAKLKALGLELSPRAEKETLIRRLSFDLRGLPPSPEEVSAFLSDSSPKAWENLVESYLADPALGERFAWPWLDAARYADSNGFQGDAERTMWPWRDWVVDAINRNLPYDDFTVWQIAGDLLPNATHEQILATGFLRNHAINGEGGSIPEENRVNYVFDMTETVGTVWMGLTFNCCRCHDHKYDPLSQKDYYSLTAFFNQTPVTGAGGNPQTKPIIASPSPSQLQEKESLQTKLTAHKLEREKLEKEILANQPVAPSGEAPTPWDILRPTKITANVPGLRFQTLEDQSVLTSGSNPDKVTINLTTSLPGKTYHALRLDALRDQSMTDGGIARSDSGNFVLTSFEVYLQREGLARTKLALRRPEATFEQGPYTIATVLDNNPGTGWAVYDGRPIEKDHAALFQFDKPLMAKPGDQLEIVLRHDSRHPKHYLGRFKVALSPKPNATLQPDTLNIDRLLAISAEQRTPDQRKAIHEHLVASHSGYQKLNATIKELESRLAQIEKQSPKVMVMEDRRERRKTFILAVGSYQAPGEEVASDTPNVLPPLRGEDQPNRLDLARWLVSRDHPLTARVVANRLWQDLFGIGLIKSPEDLGVQSEIPVHPELLDWLAADFMDSGWDFKNLIRTIVTSEVYRQSSKVDSLALERDPDNRLLARAPRYRLPSWMIRDQALSLSGLLVRDLGGEPVKPWQPEGLWAEVTFGGGKKRYVPDTGEKLRRRSLYTFWRRISAPPMIFDNAKRENCEVGTYRTNSPLHALATLNDPLYVECARALAYRAHRKDPANPLHAAFQIITCRAPTNRESEAISSLYQNSLKHFEGKPAEATELLETGELSASKEIAPAVQAALTTTILALLNTDEALTRE